MHKREYTRRSLLQLLGITIGAAVIPVHAHVDVAPSGDGPMVVNEPIKAEQASFGPTRLERFIRSRGIKPAHLARESGYSRQHLLRLRFGRMLPSLSCIASIPLALRQLTNQRVAAEDLFDHDDIHLAWREAHGQPFEEHEQEELRAAFGRRTFRALLNGERA